MPGAPYPEALFTLGQTIEHLYAQQPMRGDEGLLAQLCDLHDPIDIRQAGKGIDAVAFTGVRDVMGVPVGLLAITLDEAIGYQVVHPPGRQALVHLGFAHALPGPRFHVAGELERDGGVAARLLYRWREIGADDGDPGRTLSRRERRVDRHSGVVERGDVHRVVIAIPGLGDVRAKILTTQHGAVAQLLAQCGDQLRTLLDLFEARLATAGGADLSRRLVIGQVVLEQ